MNQKALKNYKSVEILSHSNGKPLKITAKIASGFWSRFKGLQFSKPLSEAEGLLIFPCSSIHTCFMSFSIDAAFIDHEGEITELFYNLNPWRTAIPRQKGVWGVLETKAGVLEKAGLSTGQKLQFLRLE